MNDDIKKIIQDAKDSTFTAKRILYLKYQQDIIDLHLTNCEYTEAIKLLSEALGV